MITKDTIIHKFESLFQSTPLVVRSPGRINIIGEHTDYNDGFVLPAAIDKAVYVAVSKRSDTRVSLYAEDYQERYEIELADRAPTDSHWPNYILGVVDQLIQRGHAVQGFNLYIDGDIPLGAGLSSSAAVECATALALSELFELDIPRLEIPKIGQLAEHAYAGVKCGIMDQFASTFGKKDHVIKLDCRSLDFEYVPLQLEGYTIVLFNSNVKHSLASTAYNKRREQCEQAVEWIQAHHPEVKSLRDANISMLDTLVKNRDMEVYTKARFVVEEIARLQLACKSLQEGDIPRLGQYMFDTHDGLSRAYEVSCPELDFLVDSVRSLPQVLGSRMMGGGFGGCTINIVESGYVDELARLIDDQYVQRFGKNVTVIKVHTAEGTAVL
jgi:galactokinase